MKLSQLAAKPKLIKLILDDKQIVKEYGEAIEFYTWDRQPLELFMKLANANQQDLSEMIAIVRTLILNEDGNQVLIDDNTLPSKLLIQIISTVVGKLGK